MIDETNPQSQRLYCALYHAASHKLHSQVVEYLLTKMDKIDQVDEDGRTCLFDAVSLSDETLCSMLLDKGLDIKYCFFLRISGIIKFFRVCTTTI